MKKASVVMVIVVLLGIMVKLFCHINAENQKLQQEVYALLEQDYMTDEEKDRVKFATDPDEMKESFVMLDDEHAKMFEQHFGYKR